MVGDLTFKVIRLFEFSPRKLCSWSFLYGGFFGAMAVAGFEAATQLSAAWFLAAIVFAVAAKVAHGALPLAVVPIGGDAVAD